jgi:hypothetical protein
LRYGVEPLTAARFTLLRGKQGWRLVGVEDISRECLSERASYRLRAGQIARLLLRLLPGEEENRALCISVSEGLRALAQIEEEDDATAIECVLVLRILAQLGYLPHLPEIAPFVEDDYFSEEIAQKAKRSKALLIKLINDSLSASGL